MNVVRLSPPIITLLTDFGEGSPYVAAMKGVILGICPQARIVDISHAIRPQSVEEGAFVLSTVAMVFPRGTVHVAVVDPGVGTSRLPIAIESAGVWFVGPDNGVLSAAVSEDLRPDDRTGLEAVPIGTSAMRAVHLNKQAYFRPAVSSTFHGRDIFAPVAARLAAGVRLDELGEPIKELRVFPRWRAQSFDNSELRGRVIHIDHFGNVITTISGADLRTTSLSLEIAGRQFEGLHSNYQAGPEFVVYAGSSGYVELGYRNGNAAAALGVTIGDPVRVRLEQHA